MKCTTIKCKGKIKLYQFKDYAHLKCSVCSWNLKARTKEKTIEYFLDHGGKIDGE